MEIPFNEKPRPDTGLYNAKLGIWLFLASEVMLFGALFSTYLILRLGAAPGEWPAPRELLNWKIGMVNTFVLIISSVTVVMAWASLKLKDFQKFKMYQAATVVCALIFMVIKSYEYHDKFTHYEVIKTDGVVVDGHLVEKTDEFITLSVHHAEEASAEAGHAEAGHEDHAHDDHAAHSVVEVTVPFSEIKKYETYGPWHNTYLAIYFLMTGLHALHVLGGALVMGFFLLPGSKMWFTQPERFTNRIEVSGLFWHFVDLVWIFLFPILYLM